MRCLRITMNSSVTAAHFPRHLDNLTALRYPAALFVVLLHVTPHFIPRGTAHFVTGFGYVGVSFFFMLSGFVLTWSGIPRSRTRFWWRRFSRIVPLTLVFSLVAFTVMSRTQLIPSPWAVVQNLALLQAWNPDKSTYFGGNGVTWSLSCELFFYLLFPYIIGPISHLSRPQIATLAAVVVTCLAVPPLVATQLKVSADVRYWMFYIFPPYRLGEFVIGILLARSVQLGFSGLSQRGVAIAAIIAACTCFAVAQMALKTLVHPLVSLSLMPVFGIALVAGALLHRRRDARQSPRLLVMLGEWSFALYLIHQLFFRATLGNIFGQHGIGGPLGLLVYILAATALAGVCSFLIERPCLRLLTRRRRGAPQLALATDVRAA